MTKRARLGAKFLAPTAIPASLGSRTLGNEVPTRPTKLNTGDHRNNNFRANREIGSELVFDTNGALLSTAQG
jgi:hypothetical protein